MGRNRSTHIAFATITHDLATAAGSIRATGCMARTCMRPVAPGRVSVHARGGGGEGCVFRRTTVKSAAFVGRSHPSFVNLPEIFMLPKAVLPRLAHKAH
jgi:hypothetical protein